MEYNWCEYYRKACEEERKKNTVLAGETADAEAAREEMFTKYEALCANPLYKLSRLPSLLYRGCRRVMRSAASRDQRGKTSTEGLLASYRERLALQGDRYGQWIREKEPVLWEKYREDLARKEAAGQRRCAVIPYGMLADITDLSQIGGVEAGADILLFAENAGELDERAVSCIEGLFGAYQNIKLLYGAEDHRAGERRSFPWFKPCFSPDTLLGFFYFGSYFAVDRVWAEKTALSGYGDARQNLYDFVLRLLRPYFERPEKVRFDKDRSWLTGGIYAGGSCRLPGGKILPEKSGGICADGKSGGEAEESSSEKSEEICADAKGKGSAEESSPEIVGTELILYHRDSAEMVEKHPDTGGIPETDPPEFWGYEEKYIKLKQNFIEDMGYACFSCQTPYPDVWPVVPAKKTDEGKKNLLVSVIIPSKDHPELVEKCIGSFLERTDLPGLKEKTEFIVVDNGSAGENRQKILGYLESADIKSRYLYHPMEFNFSAMCNLGVQAAKGEYILLLNDDIEVIAKDWLRIMLGQAMLPGVGAVGAKLWYPAGERIQHTGVTNMQAGPSHKLTTLPDDRTYYYGHNTVSYNMIAVTAACMLVKKDIYEKAGGFDESLAVSYNDVDFCFTLAERGYRNVLRNDAVLLHHESVSRGQDGESAEKWKRLLSEKEKLYKKHPLFLEYDPYYSGQLAGDALDYGISYHYPYEKTLLTADPETRTGKRTLQRAVSDILMLTIERIEDRRKLYLEEPDILEVEGWCYAAGQDNCLFERWLILGAEKEDFYYQIPVKERRRPDVEAILPQQKNIELSGFVCGILKQDIIFGEYTVGILYRNLCTGKLFYRQSERKVQIV